MSFNKIIVLGRVTRDIELKTSKTGGYFCNLSIPTNEKRGEIENTTWFNVTAFGKQAETIAKYVRKGDELYIEGSLTTGSYVDKNDKTTKFTLEVRMSDFKLLSKPKAQAAAATAPAPSKKAGVAQVEPEPADDTDVPF